MICVLHDRFMHVPDSASYNYFHPVAKQQLITLKLPVVYPSIIHVQEVSLKGVVIS